jgi:SAM-dependent methyltransferase
MSGAATPSAEFWEARYQAAPPQWGTQPNAAFVKVMEELRPSPGTALELGCGHGGDTLWLASLGWRVTAVDVSATAVERVAAGARARGLGDQVTAVQCDVSQEIPAGEFSLVYACYFHSPVHIARDSILGAAASRVRAGGLLVIVDHASAAPWSWTPHEHYQFPSPAGTLAAAGLGDGWQTELAAARQRVATGPDGTTTATVTDNVIAARRT